MITTTNSPKAGQTVAVIRPPRTVKKLLVPIDFSSSSRAALQYAATYATQSHASIALLAVIPYDHTAYEYGEVEAINLREECMKQWRHDLKKLAEETFGHASHQELVRVGRPFEEIVLAARDMETDLIIIARHSHKGSIHTELGSTAERVIRYAACPVLVVPAAADEAKCVVADTADYLLPSASPVKRV